MASAGTAGFMYWVAFYPTDVVKSAMMTDSLDPVRRHAVLRPPFSAKTPLDVLPLTAPSLSLSL